MGKYSRPPFPEPPPRHVYYPCGRYGAERIENGRLYCETCCEWEFDQLCQKCGHANGDHVGHWASMLWCKCCIDPANEYSYSGVCRP